jgi:hypothetical protein
MKLNAVMYRESPEVLLWGFLLYKQPLIILSAIMTRVAS